MNKKNYEREREKDQSDLKKQKQKNRFPSSLSNIQQQESNTAKQQ